MPMSCSDHAVFLKATAQHGRRETACGLPARVRLIPATTRSSAKVVIRRIPISDAGGQCETKQRLSWTRKTVVAAHYKKDDLLHCGLAVRMFPATMRTFTKDTALSEQGRGVAWHMCINARHGMGTAWARHGNGRGTACYVWIGIKDVAQWSLYIAERLLKTSQRVEVWRNFVHSCLKYRNVLVNCRTYEGQGFSV